MEYGPNFCSLVIICSLALHTVQNRLLAHYKQTKINLSLKWLKNWCGLLVWYDKGPQDIIVILQDIVVKTGKNLAINKFHLEPPSELPWHWKDPISGKGWLTLVTFQIPTFAAFMGVWACRVLRRNLVILEAI